MSAANVVDAPAGLAGLAARYKVGERLGSGASGETYAADDGGAACVIKVVAAAAQAAALAEFRGLEGLAHPSVVRVRDIGRLADGRTYLITDRIAGPGIGDIASIADEARRRAAFERAAQGLASALAHLHARGLVHGDVSPGNVRLAGDGDDGRAVLIDFGLAGPPLSGDGRARGTLGYAAPEALTGARTPAIDLFALGATLYEAWCGAAPFGRGLPAVQRMLTGRPPPLSSVRPGLGGEWDRLLERLLAADPAERPGSARELMRALARLTAGSATPTEIDLAAPYPDGDPLEGLFVGRHGERAALRAALERLAEGNAPAVVGLIGPPGSGRRTLFEMVAREVAVAAAAGAMPAVEVWRGDVDALARFAGVADVEAGPGVDPQRVSDARLARICEALDARAVARPLCIALTDGAASEGFAAFAAGAAPRGRLLIVVPMRAAPDRVPAFLTPLALAPLGADDVAALLAAAGSPAPAPSTAEAVARAAQGNAALIGVLARRVIAAERAGRTGEISIDGGADLDGLLAAGFAALPPEGQAVVVALALGDAVTAETLAGEGARAARAAGWVARGDGGGAGVLPSAAHRQAALAAAPAPLRTQLATRALLRLPADDPRRADALAAAGRPDDAAALLCALARGAGASGRAAGLLARAAALAPERLTLDDWLSLVNGLAVLGRYDAAAGALAQAQALATDAGARTRCCEREGWLRTRRGDLPGAREALARGLAEGGDATLRARLGRLLVTAGRFREALETVAPLLGDGAAGDAASAPLVAETVVLALAYAGDGAAARSRLAELAASGRLDEARSGYLAGLVAQLAGEDGAALEAYRRSYELAARAADVHTVAAVTLNLGGLLADRGLYTEALAASERAVRELGRLGAAELATALVNAANLFVQLGDLPAARRALERARSRASDRQVTLALAPAAFVEGDAERRAGRPLAAVAPYRAAAAAFAEGGQPHLAARALFAAVEAFAEAGHGEEARAQLAAAEGQAPQAPETADPAADVDPVAIDAARAQARLALGEGRGDEALATRLDELARRAQAAARRPLAWRLGALAARLAERSGAGSVAQSRREFARSCFEEVRMATPEHHRAGLAQDPDAAWLLGGSANAGDAALATRALAAEGQLRRLLRINKRLNSEQRLPRLLELIVDTVIELTDAERGFLLLDDDGGGLQVKVARNIDQETLGTAEFELSRSIAQQAAAGGEPIVTIDATGDARFREALSVSDLHLRSVLAVPLAVKGKVVGTIYVDHRLRKGAFDQDDVNHVLDFAEQAAIALENARLLAELRRRERQVEALNRRLEAELAARREELSGIKVELRDSREALAVRYDYRNIVGRTPRMLELFRLLDRITDTTLPVVIQGESGTGKELVARAIHTNGPRRERPFVGENCAAIPETLLESTLFGYTRGAFTGAEHDTKGLFEIADSGTLFLDEVGEMSPAMQGKLLRVLQEGELRRVGSERTRKVDVRIVTATNRDLARMVDEGKFRRDLYFRLNVAAIALPPLRDRREDIPLMVEHFLAKAAKSAAPAGRPVKPIDPDALARLCAYRWPGNVRELENELTRADAFSAARITAADLSPHVAAAGDPGAVAIEDPDSLLLKPRVERLERSLLREALGRAANNQTRAAELLGLSRFGLQKKLKRYRFA